MGKSKQLIGHRLYFLHKNNQTTFYSYLGQKILHYLLYNTQIFIYFLKILWYLTPNTIFSQLDKLNTPTSQSDR